MTEHWLLRINVSTQRQRPVGVTLIAVLVLISGVLVASRRVLMLADVYLEPSVSVNFSWSFKIGVLGEIALSLIAMFSGIGLLVGAKWGWWLGAIHFAWRIGRQGLLLATSIVANQPADSVLNDESEISRLIGPLIILCLLLLYLFSQSVWDYFCLPARSRFLALLIISGAGFLLSMVVHFAKLAVQ